MNSWVVLHAGGSDLDSPYNVVVGANEPALIDTQQVYAEGKIPKVVRPGPPNASPIGFRYVLDNVLVPSNTNVPYAPSPLHPVFDAARVDRNPIIAAYLPMASAGQAYVVLKSVDGNNGLDNRIPVRPRVFYNAPPGGANDPLLSRVLTFKVNFPPVLEYNRPGFVPRPDTTFFTRSNIRFNLFANDPDPYDPSNKPSNVGGPSTTTVLRWTVTLSGKTQFGRDTTFIPPGGFRVSVPTITVSVPDFMPGTDVTAIVELCDCSDCENSDGSGRCITDRIPFHVPALTPQQVGQSSSISIPRPGPNPIMGRSTPR
jgi:hypothetical protein